MQVGFGSRAVLVAVTAVLALVGLIRTGEFTRLLFGEVLGLAEFIGRKVGAAH